MNVEGISNAYLAVPKNYLSLPFNITRGQYVDATILEIVHFPDFPTSQKTAMEKELIGSKVRFLLTVSQVGSEDLLFFDSSSWAKLRDYGIILTDYLIKIRIIDIVQDGKEIEVYPKRDVEAV
jgi:hypothetical protein